MNDSSETYELVVERMVNAEPVAVFDSFTGLYDDPDQSWVLVSQMDLRDGGTWDLSFKPPGTTGFKEHRVITKLDKPNRLA